MHMVFRRRDAAYVLALVLGFAARAHAQAPAQPVTDAQSLRNAIEDLKKDFDQKLAALESRLAAVENAQKAAAEPAAAPAVQAAPPVAAPQAAVPPEPAGATGASVSNAKVFNPDIAVIGDFLGAVGHPNADPANLITPLPLFQMHESEASFQAVVDPYARADFFISFGEEGVDLEEGFVTFTSLPGGLLTKVGKFRAAFGKVNTLHNHVLPWTDRPLVTQNLVAGEDGIDAAGISVARLIPNPWFFLEATGQIFRGDSGDAESPLYVSTERTHFAYVTHLRGYQDINEATNLDLGVSYSRGFNGSGIPQGVDNLTTNLFGVDATLRWKPLQRSIYHSFTARSEVIWSRREQLNGVQHSNGFYASAEYQFARRWFAGVRFDGADRAYNSAMHDSGGSFILTYWPSEFSQVRGQYRHMNWAVGPSADELLFQVQFAIGAHGAHPF
jgi:hypothetical protein